MSRIVGRADWGYREARTPASAPRNRDALVVHHAVTPEWTGVQAPRGIQQIHLDMGWATIGYTLVATQAGEIYSARPLAREGAHTRGHNRSVHAVCVAGNFDQHTPTDECLDALAWLFAHGRERGWWGDVLRGHRDYGSTSCPGANLYAALGEVRRRADSPAVADETIEEMEPMDGTLLYVTSREGTPDALAALWQAVGRGDGVAVTADRDLAQAELDRGTTVLAVGGPAARDLDDAEGVVGDTWADTGERLAARLDDA